MAKPQKTRPGVEDVGAFLDAIPDPGRRKDCQDLLELMQRLSGAPPRLWGGSMVGFGSYHYRYDSGREGDWFQIGFAPRKNDLTLYLMSGFEARPDLMARLGKHKTGKSCLYIKHLSDIDANVLEELAADALTRLRAMYATSP